MSNVDLERYARNDPLAQSIYESRNVAPKDAAGQGRFSNAGIEGELKQDIANARAQAPQRKAATPIEPGVKTEGGTIGAARTNIPGLEGRAFIGKSPQAGGQVNPNSEFGPATDPKKLPHTHGHAEQHIADQLSASLKSVPREKLRGASVWILIEQEPCSTCAQGTINPDTASGVLKKLSNEFPELRFEIKNLDSSGRIVLEAHAPAASGSKLVPAEPPSINKPPPEVTGEAPAPSTPKALAIEPPAAPPKVPPALAEGSVPKGAPGIKLPEASGTGPKVPALKEADLLGGRAKPSLAKGRVGRIGAAAMEGALLGALDVALIVTQLVIEFVVLPILEKWQRELEAEQRERIQKKIQQEIDDFQVRRIKRKLRDCYLKQIRAAEAAGKKLYAKVDLRVRIEDTSNRLEPFSKTLPDSPFDLDVDSVALGSVRLIDKAIEPSATKLECVKSCGVSDEGASLPLGGHPLWERTITVSFEAPSSESLLKEFPQRPGENLDAQSDCCFIATACYGSLLAPEVEALRRFRDRRLIAHGLGRGFVRAYYFVSPPIARWLERRDACRAIVRGCLVGPIAHAISRAGWDQ